MNRYVTDTHALYWYLIASPNLSAAAKAAFDEGKQGQALIYIPAIVLAELYYLNKKLGEPINFAANFGQLQTGSQFVFVPLEASDVLDFDSHAAVPEMHDRMIAGVAKRLGLPCITRDLQIANSGLVSTIW
ncbi:MAG: type II toxin-antitoxin system VapC family toxin [Blastocatellia bacterium]